MLSCLLLIQHEPTKGDYARPFDATAGIPDKVMMPIYWIALFILAYVVIRVWISLKKGK